MILSVTGHRPDKLGGYARWEGITFPLLRDLAVTQLSELRPSLVCTGLALGFDQAVADACASLDVPYVAAVPFIGQESRWSLPMRTEYHSYLAGASEVVVVSEGAYAAWKMHKRNEYMVDRCDLLLALYNGDLSGGTYRCVEYAKRRGKEIINCWEEWTSASQRA